MTNKADEKKDETPAADTKPAAPTPRAPTKSEALALAKVERMARGAQAVNLFGVLAYEEPGPDGKPRRTAGLNAPMVNDLEARGWLEAERVEAPCVVRRNNKDSHATRVTVRVRLTPAGVGAIDSAIAEEQPAS